MKTEDVQEHFRVQASAYPELMQRLIPHYDLQRDVMAALMPSDRTLPLRILDLGGRVPVRVEIEDGAFSRV
jgi:hypothetical protein